MSAPFRRARPCFEKLAKGTVEVERFQLNGIWVPWYTEHKILAGLLDAHQLAGNAKALDVAIALGAWAEELTRTLSEEALQRMLYCEHGGMNESFAELYARTGQARFLEASRRFHHQEVLDPLAKGQDCLPGMHANTQVPKIIGVARRYELTGDQEDYRIADFFWDRVVQHHSYATGGHSDAEHFGPPDQLSDRMSHQTCETCNVYNMLKLTRHLFTWNPTAEKADFYERALYNHILASQNPDDGMMCYFVPVKTGYLKTYNTPFDSFWCCTGTGMENHVRYNECIYFEEPGGLYVNLYIPSTLDWKAEGVRLRLETAYPEEEEIRIHIEAAPERPFALHLRIPGWITAPPELTFNAQPINAATPPGNYLSLNRVWKQGDCLTLRLPMGLRLDPMPDKVDRVAIAYGPLLLAGDLGAPEDSEDRAPILLTAPQNPAAWIHPLKESPLTFQTGGVGRPHDITLRPFYLMHQRRYALYFDCFTQSAWEAHEKAWRQAEAARKALDERTLDQVRIGEQQSEIDHHFKGEKTRTGAYKDRKWRDAPDGFFSYRLKTQGETALELQGVYWGDDQNHRTFDILVDGNPIATQQLEKNQPGAFFEVAYPIPEALLRGKRNITVCFKAQEGHTAGGLFGLRLLRKE